MDASLVDGLLEIQRLLAGGGDSSALAAVLQVTCELTGAESGTLIVIASGVVDQPFVVATSDHPNLEGRVPVAFEAIPNVRRALDEKQVIPGETHTTIPFAHAGRATGALVLKGPTDANPARVVANLVAEAIAGGMVLTELREQTQPVSIARYMTERRLKAIEQLQSYFEAASDGVVVLDGDGLILYVNRAAESITGYAKSHLVGRPLTELVPAEQRTPLEQVISHVLGGSNLEAFDLELHTTSGHRICVSVSTSTVLGEHGAAILSFRDVTSERLLESELRKTKDFLEKLIDSTVDGIIAADIDGRVILFNAGAERIFGFAAEDVIHQLPVERLYPDGVARQIMRQLRSQSHGGVGRLEQTRREVITKTGELVPVNMTASIIYEGGEEVATVGILSDLRDRIKIEQRLLQAQEKLLVTEKQAVVAELAGAAAHELNQPLTSVILYAEMLLRKIAEGDPQLKSAQMILQQAQRMAEIVKKIGRITKYETKQYVGGASILDLEKSSAEPTPPVKRS